LTTKKTIYRRRHLVVRVDEPNGDVARDAAVAVDVSRRAVGRHGDARRLAEVGVPGIVVEHQALECTNECVMFQNYLK
jgi:hypothetical protein